MTGIGKIGNLKFRALSYHALRSVFIFGNRPLDLYIDLRDAEILLNVCNDDGWGVLALMLRVSIAVGRVGDHAIHLYYTS